jgi:hypothetical protein
MDPVLAEGAGVVVKISHRLHLAQPDSEPGGSQPDSEA